MKIFEFFDEIYDFSVKFYILGFISVLLICSIWTEAHGFVGEILSLLCCLYFYDEILACKLLLLVLHLIQKEQVRAEESMHEWA